MTISISPFVRPWPDVPVGFVVRNPKCLEELEVLILDVLGLVRGNAMRGEEPVQIARSLSIEANLHRCGGEGGDDSGLEIHLEIQHEIELPLAEFGAYVGEGSPTLRAVEQNDFVHVPVTTN